MTDHQGASTIRKVAGTLLCMVCIAVFIGAIQYGLIGNAAGGKVFGGILLVACLATLGWGFFEGKK